MSTLSNYVQNIKEHYERLWGASESEYWDKGPLRELPRRFSVLRFEPRAKRRLWTYATCGMSLPSDSMPLELHIYSQRENRRLVELLAVVTHYHRTGSLLGLGDTVNFGEPWFDGSQCDHALISLPYLDGPDLEWLELGQVNVRFLWLIPITPLELEHKKRFGLESLEAQLESARVDYADPKRPSVV